MTFSSIVVLCFFLFTNNMKFELLLFVHIHFTLALEKGNHKILSYSSNIMMLIPVLYMITFFYTNRVVALQGRLVDDIMVNFIIHGNYF